MVLDMKRQRCYESVILYLFPLLVFHTFQAQVCLLLLVEVKCLTECLGSGISLFSPHFVFVLSIAAQCHCDKSFDSCLWLNDAEFN